MTGSQSRRRRLFLYPEPIPGPDIPYRNEKKQNPIIRGWGLVVAAFVMEWLSFVSRMAWNNAGFASLRKLQQYIEHTEPWFEPVVFPVEDAAPNVNVSEDQAIGTGHDVEQEPTIVLSALKKNSAAHYRALYLSGELTPLDVVHAIIPFIRRDVTPPGEHSLAWFDVKIDRVLEAAKASTLRYQEKRSLGPLDGVPTAVKDEYDMEGYITTLGSVNDYTGQQLHGNKIDTWCIQKLEEAGIIIVGKVSMHEFGMDTSGNNITYGTPRNPYNQKYYTGGSSSGSAYAVAAGLVPFTLGSDGGGSIRIPSSFCSVFGLKTTHGRLSFHPGQNHSKTCGVNGPIAADMQTLAALYAVVNKPDPSSHFPSPTTAKPLTNDPNRAKVIGVPEAWFNHSTPAIQSLCRDVINKLVTQKNYTVVPITIPFLVEGQIAHALTILTDAATLLPKTDNLSPANKILLALGRCTPSTDYLLAQKLRRVLMQHLAYLWTTYPGMVIVTPTTACPGWPIRSKSELVHGVSDGDQTLKTMEYVWLGNFCGVPSLSVPAGYVVPEGQVDEGEVAGSGIVGKVPVGLMATGEWCSEDNLMMFGLDAEEVGAETHSRPPCWVDVVALAKGQRGADTLYRD